MMDIRVKRKKVLKEIVKYTLMVLLAAILLFPFFVMLTRSFMTWKEATSYPVQILPEKLNFASYGEAISGDFFVYLKNTLIVLIVNVVGVTLSAYVVAYGFARIRFRGNGVLFAIALSTMMLPGIVSQVPLYVFYSKIGWLNTLLPLTIPPLFGISRFNGIKEFYGKIYHNAVWRRSCRDSGNPFRCQKRKRKYRAHCQ